MNTRKVYVNNIPVQGWLEGWVDVPGDTKPEELQAEIANAIKRGRFQPADGSEGEIEYAGADKATIDDGWEFSLPLEET